jgi:hypothetical protein
MTTLSSYLLIQKDLPRYQKITASEPMIKAQTKYYQDNIGNVKTPEGLVKNFRLFSYAMTAFGLGDQIYAKAMIQKVLEQGIGSSKNLAFTLNNPRILAFAKTFNFAANGADTTSSDAVKTGVVNQYVQQQMETEQGQKEPGVQLALYFQRNAPNIKSVYNILADKNLLTVVQTALNISPMMSMMDVDRQASLLSSKVKLEDFKDPAKLEKFVQRFSALYDISNSSSQSAAPNAMLRRRGAGLVGMSSSLLSQLQGLRIGGV